MSNNYGDNVDVDTSSSTSSGEGDYTSIEPTTVEEDEGLQSDLNGEDDIGSQDDAGLNLDQGTWEGMESGDTYREYEGETNWLDTVPEKYAEKAKAWSNQQSMLKITPRIQRQKFTYSTIAYIADMQQDPKVQIFPISNVNVIPHQITFDFYDTTEGRIGVSNAVEKHMEVECDIYLTDLIYQYWNHGNDNQNDFSRMNWSNEIKKMFWDAINSGNDYNKLLSSLTDLELTTEFADFRNTFLQQHLGWVCLFSSHTFGIFQGVITEVSYSINEGETFAKWHLKFAEALFLEGAYSNTGQKQSADDSTGEDGSTEDSGDASNTE